MPDRLAKIKKGDVVVYVIPDRFYTKAIKELGNALANKKGSFCYVTLDRVYADAIKDFSADALKKVIFIDGKTTKKNEESGNCIHVNGKNLTALSITIASAFKAVKFNYFLFDSLSCIVQGKDYHPTAKFFQSLTNTIKSYGTTAIFTIKQSDTEKDPFKDMSMFVDSIVKH